jgi:hypothetical protein
VIDESASRESDCEKGSLDERPRLIRSGTLRGDQNTWKGKCRDE